MKEALLYDGASRSWRRFVSPVDVVSVNRTDAVRPALEAVAHRVDSEGLYAVGFVAYEAAPAFDAALEACPPTGLVPLLCFGLFRDVERVATLPRPDAAGHHQGWVADISTDRYRKDFARVRSFLASGDTYQVNYTLRMTSRAGISPYRLFHDLVRAQPTAYATFIDADSYAICSVSPELFFELDGPRLRCKPMKGTTARGQDAMEDGLRRDALVASEKNRAENVMIVDMVRNDLGRIADVGSVSVSDLFSAEAHPTVWQLTSTVTARTSHALADIFAALFPCASVTGAPKARTMRIIAELESRPRGVYTGAIGVVEPGSKARFSVAIRTATVDKAAESIEYGVGGGIVWDSVADSEVGEARDKARVLDHAAIGGHELLETFRWSRRKGYVLIEAHLARLRAAAAHFGFRCDEYIIVRGLENLAQRMDGDERRIRLTLARDGKFNLSDSAMPAPCDRPLRVDFARHAVDPRQTLLRFKTTDRTLYEEAAAGRDDVDEVILVNDRDEVTESTIANVVIERNGELVTPPTSCGLLPGVRRSALVAAGTIREGVIQRDDLRGAGKIWLVSSLRGWRRAVLATSDEPALP